MTSSMLRRRIPANDPRSGEASVGTAPALAIAVALAQLAGNTLPWKTVRDAIGGAMQAQSIGLAKVN